MFTDDWTIWQWNSFYFNCRTFPNNHIKTHFANETSLTGKQESENLCWGKVMNYNYMINVFLQLVIVKQNLVRVEIKNLGVARWV